ncbi:MAG: hypothetical protein HDQ96_05155 [Lachnospiraceae bacterium]|nr:hypothetical protein [Lachnospiraceae bacterium]
MAMSKTVKKKVWKVLILISVLVCLFGILSYKRMADTDREPFYGTWYIEKVAMISEMYTGTTLDGGYEEDLFDSEDFLGYELEYTSRYFRIGDKKYKNPEYKIEYKSVESVNSSGNFRPVDIYGVINKEKIKVNNEEDYTADTLLLWFNVEFLDEVSYGKYDFIPVGTHCILLNEDTMIVGIWGKVLLARRIN